MDRACTPVQRRIMLRPWTLSDTQPDSDQPGPVVPLCHCMFGLTGTWLAFVSSKPRLNIVILAVNLSVIKLFPLACLVMLLLTETRQHAWHAPGRHHMGRDPIVTGLPADLHLHLLLLQRPAERPQHHPQEPLHQPLHRWVTVSGRDQQSRSAGKMFMYIIKHVDIHIAPHSFWVYLSSLVLFIPHWFLVSFRHL